MSGAVERLRFDKLTRVYAYDAIAVFMTVSTVCSSAQRVRKHHKFTGKERDTETGLDYFGGRYYASNMGRWMSPDWSPKPLAVPFADDGYPLDSGCHNR